MAQHTVSGAVPRRYLVSICLFFVTVGATACGGPPAVSMEPSVPASVASAEASPSMPDDDAPEELQGTWEATISTGEHVTLELRSSGYTVNREGAQGSGSISVDGENVTFASARCELGTGTYQWSIDDGTLTFAPLEPRDPCGNRIIFLEDAAYTRVE